jgi:hypothetical protein
MSSGSSSSPSFVATPLNDLGTGTYKGFQGGLYENGSNSIPTDHVTAGLSFANAVQPLDTNGNPSATGHYVMASIGMSNTTDEFCSPNSLLPCNSWTFMGQAATDSAVNHTALAIVDGARGGQDASTWTSPTSMNYDLIMQNWLTPMGLTEAQVQVIWLKEADAGPSVSLPAPNADAYTLETNLGAIVRTAKTRYPHLQLVFVSSRIYAGYATTTLNPEPYAYESGFANKWLIQAQINQIRTGTIVDTHAGDLNYSTGVAPWLAWAAYLWADGTTARSDGLVWLLQDFQPDGTHPSPSGQQKVGTMLLNFFKTSPFTKCWFLSPGTAACP